MVSMSMSVDSVAELEVEFANEARVTVDEPVYGVYQNCTAGGAVSEQVSESAGLTVEELAKNKISRVLHLGRVEGGVGRALKEALMLLEGL